VTISHYYVVIVIFCLDVGIHLQLYHCELSLTWVAELHGLGVSVWPLQAHEHSDEYLFAHSLPVKTDPVEYFPVTWWSAPEPTGHSADTNMVPVRQLACYYDVSLVYFLS